MFFNKEANKRSIEDILMPKDKEGVDISEDAESVESEIDEEIVEQKCEKTAKNGVPFNAGEFNALTCFGWSQLKTEKWLIKFAKVWFGIMSLMWFLFGAATFAPVIFISNKINVIFKDKKKSILFGMIIHILIIALIVIFFISRRTSNNFENV